MTQSFSTDHAQMLHTSLNSNNPLYGVFGGTFDPLHNGHIETVLAVCDQCALERVYFIPLATPPHRGHPHANPQQRLEMVSLALANHSRFEVDDRELKRRAPSYTYDTIQSLQAQNADKRYCLILGIDALLGISRWYRWQALLDSVHCIVIPRIGWDIPEPLPDWWQQRHVKLISDLRQHQRGKICLIEVNHNPESATEIRYGIARGIDVSTMMPPSVWDYICLNGLYGA